MTKTSADHSTTTLPLFKLTEGVTMEAARDSDRGARESYGFEFCVNHDEGGYGGGADDVGSGGLRLRWKLSTEKHLTYFVAGATRNPKS